MNPVRLLKCLADDTRLRLVLLLLQQQELCVCELVYALNLGQSTISRHLAQLRSAGLLQDRRHEQWVYYRIHPDLAQWAQTWLAQLSQLQTDWNSADQQRLSQMGDQRPIRRAQCCPTVDVASNTGKVSC